MGTTAEKGARVLQSIAEVQEGINNLGGSLTDQTPFKDFKTELDNIYDTLPKTSFQEGTDVTIEGGLKGKLDFEDDIVGIGDTSQKSYQGYQMIRQASFGTFTNNGVTFTQRADGSILVNGTTTSNGASINLLTGDATVVNNDNNIAILPNQAYTLSGANDPIRVVLHTSSYSYVKNANTTFTETGNVSMSALRIIVPADTTINNVVMYPMLEKGSTAHDYEPYVGGTASPNPSYPQEIEVVRGKNRLKPITIDRTIKGVKITSNDNGKITIKGTATDSINDPIWGSWGGSNVLCELPQGNYVSSGLGTNSPRLNIVANGTTTIFTGNSTKTLTSTAKITGIFLYVNNGESVDMTFEPMIEKGSQATSYLPYNTIEVKARGKNHLLCRTDIPIGYTRTDNGITWQRTGENTFKINGTASGNFTLVIGTATPLMEYLKTGETYTLSGCPSGGSDSTYRLQIFNYNGTNTAYDTGSGATFVSNIVSTSNVAIRVFDGVTINNLEFNVQIELGSTKTSFIPFEVTTKQLSLGNFKPSKIGNYKDYFYRTSGKNLFDNSVERKNAYIGASGSDIGTAITYYNSSATYTYVNCAYVEAGKTYTLSWKQNTTPASTNLRVGAIVDNNNIILNTQNTWTNSSTSITFTPNVSGYLVLCTDINATNIQLELGNTATDYNPYGNGEWYFKGKNGEVVLNGSENLTLYNSGTDNWYYRATLDTDVGTNLTSATAYCSHYPINNIGNSNTLQGLQIIASVQQLRIRYETEDTIANFKDWLVSNNVNILYPLQTPTDTKITDTTMISQLEELYNLMSYNGTTIIEINGNLPMIIKVRALKGE